MNACYKFSFLRLLLLLVPSLVPGLSNLTAQLPPAFRLLNAGFEGEPADATLPVGWLTSTPGTTPDILPGYWGVYQEAVEGNTYLGLITRPNGSWEAIAQQLPRRLAAGECYQMSVDLAHSLTYSGYSGPLRFRLYGGKNRKDRSYLLYESPVVDHSSWKTYFMQFTLSQDVDYFIIEAFYDEAPFNYPGNILIDNISSVVSCPRA